MDQQQKLQDHHYAIRSWYVCLGNTRDRWSANECVKTSEVASTHAQLGRTTMKRPALEKFGELQKQLAELDEYHFKAPLACQLAPSSESCPETHLATHRQHPQATLDPHTVWENMAEVQKHMAELDDFPFKAPLAGQLELSSGSCLELNLATHDKDQEAGNRQLDRWKCL